MQRNNLAVDRAALMRKMAWVTRKNLQESHGDLDQMGLGFGQVPALMELSKHGALNQRELAGLLHVTAATMSGMLKRMEKLECVERLPVPGDARVMLVRLTDRGREMVLEVQSILDRSGSTMLKQLTDAECAILDGILNKLAK